MCMNISRFYYGVNYGAHITHKSVFLAKLSFNAYKNGVGIVGNLFFMLFVFSIISD